jgi:Ca-activated chloride channel homolog
MFKKSVFRFSLLIVFISLFAVLPAAAQDCPPPPVCECPPGAECICPLPPDTCIQPPIVPGVFTNPEWLRVEWHRVEAKITNQIATTSIDMQFRNEGNGLAEGTFVFPLPGEAAVDELTMFINGLAIEARILPADEARGIYDEIVRQYRDPALLEYVGMSAIQASVFPIPPGETRRIQISYTQVLEAENGLIHYVYPLQVTELLSSRPVDGLSVRVEVEGQDAISNIYSPSHPIAISRSAADTAFTTGYESSGSIPTDDFSLYYGIASQRINANLLTYRESATEDGFFMLMVQPPVSLPQDQIIPKDVIIVLDQSGSMFGDKWDQARDAATYVLENINESDRFNVVLFSTGWRVYSNQMETPAQASAAIDWVQSQEAVGGTDINGALTTALAMADAERPTTILFLTDGLATEGEVDPNAILSNVTDNLRPNVRIFSFGVGDDVDTILLDQVVEAARGTGSYVRPTERIDEEVASLYSKINAPVLTDVSLDLGGVVTDDLYPAQLPDLFAGTQLTLVGRYRGESENLSITLRGQVNGQEQVFVYSGMEFPGRAGGQPFIARLWATRRIGDLLNAVRLNGENPELVDSIVRLSVRYGIITPYTSFLIEEDDILSAQGMAQAQSEFFMEAERSGEAAVAAADAAASIANAAAPMAAPMPTQTAQMGADGVMMQEPADNPLQMVNDKTFLLQDGAWVDTTYQSDTMTTTPVVFLSEAYFALLDQSPLLGDYLALGERVIVVWEGVAYEIVPA